MVKVILVESGSGNLKVLDISKYDWHTAKAAIAWKATGNWPKIKDYVYRNNLHKPKTKSKHSKTLMERVFG